MIKDSYIGVDLGGTNIRGALVEDRALTQLVSKKINAAASQNEVLQQVFELVDGLVHEEIRCIGIGVPGLVDTAKGVVYDVINIPSWTEVPLQQLLQDRYHLPVAMENDANCFALGEFHFGKGRGQNSMLGLTIGTGLGSGIIINGRLYAGANGGAGEFGMIDYLDRYYEYYASGQFFRNCHGLDGEDVFKRAKAGDAQAISLFEEMGSHLGNAIKTIVYALDLNMIILGGSVAKAFPYFSATMWKNIRTLAFKNPAGNLIIEVSELENSNVLGAAALCYE